MDSIDKEWARKYILDPLTAPEPSQETGPGSSHYNPHRVSRAANASHSHSYSQPQSQSQLRSPRQVPRRLNSPEVGDDKTSPISPPPQSKSAGSRSNRSGRSKSDSFSSTIIAASPSSSFHPSNPYASFVQSPTAGPASKDPSTSPSNPQPNGALNRNRSLQERSRADIRPLNILEQEKRVVERVHRHRKRISDVDMIDSLDTIGGAYHHGGPYDATLISRNLHWKSSPLAAVHDSNMEAIRATPREFIIDSLDQHIPLHGTATIPPGSPDYSGSRMDYVEGSDLMRDADAPGGPYKRYNDVKYHPDDLKGKGEPSYTLELDLKAKDRRLKEGGSPEDYEMQSSIGSRRGAKNATRQRSFSDLPRPVGMSIERTAYAADVDIRRRDSTGKRLSDGLKRRFSSLRRKKAMPTEEVR